MVAAVLKLKNRVKYEVQLEMSFERRRKQENTTVKSK